MTNDNPTESTIRQGEPPYRSAPAPQHKSAPSVSEDVERDSMASKAILILALVCACGGISLMILGDWPKYPFIVNNLGQLKVLIGLIATSVSALVAVVALASGPRKEKDDGEPYRR